VRILSAEAWCTDDRASEGWVECHEARGLHALNVVLCARWRGVGNGGAVLPNARRACQPWRPEAPANGSA
jgi:hypothetical protein